MTKAQDARMAMDLAIEPIYERLRPRLVRLAYRMLGSLADAGDAVQDAWLRWLNADRAAVREPAAFLHTLVVRCCINELNSARRRRETYCGPWLPEPIVDNADESAIDDITLPLMVALERLSPLERAAFLLHDVFGMGFKDVAAAIGREAGACRQLASRARCHVRAARPRFEVPPDEGRAMTAAFFKASREGDLEALRTLLADDVAVYTDGGGKVSAVAMPIIGLKSVLALFRALSRLFARSPSQLLRYVVIDGLPGFVTIEEARTLQTTALRIEQRRIATIYVTRNPDKLTRVV